MPTRLTTAEGRAAAAQRDRAQNLERIEQAIDARLRMLAKQYGLDMSDERALIELSAKDAVLQELATKQLVIERFSDILVKNGYVPAIGDDGEVVWDKPFGA
jgi:hypothetical protein